MGFFDDDDAFTLHRDIHEEIFKKLDSKSLARFKLVSKGWFFKLSSPSFIKAYRSRSPSSITGFFYKTSERYSEKIQYVPIDKNEEYICDPPACLGFLDSPALLSESCNGLLHWVTSKDHRHFISNPLLHKYVPLPWPFSRNDSASNSSSSSSSGARLFCCGLAYDPLLDGGSGDNFKYVVLMCEPDSVYLKSMVYSSGENSGNGEWGEKKQTLVSTDDVGLNHHRYQFSNLTSTWFASCSKGVFLNGSMHWELGIRNKFVSYNVRAESACWNRLPVMENLVNSLGWSKEPGCFGESKGGRLNYCRVIGTLLCIWVAEQEPTDSNDSVKWFHWHMIDLSDKMCIKHPTLRHHGSHALALIDACEGVLLTVKGKLIMYRLAGDTVEEVAVELRRNGKPADFLAPTLFFPFVHSCALLKIPAGTCNDDGLSRS